MRQHMTLLIYGFAVFSMFFGSGNLVFPLQIGHLAGVHWFAAFMGLVLTGVLLPFLGLFVIKLYHGSYVAFFAEAGELARVLLPMLTLGLIGPFGVIPRCIVVAHGGMTYLFPHLSLAVFSILFCVVTGLLCLQEQFMVRVLGKWMSPVLLVALSVLIFMGIKHAPAIGMVTDGGMREAFNLGFLTGYQTMDLFGAFFFSALIFLQIQQTMPVTATLPDVIRFAIKSSVVSALLLGAVYVCFVFLGAHYAAFLAHVEPQTLLPTIAYQAMGKQGVLFIAVAMLLSCLTTAVALNNVFVRYVHGLLQGGQRQLMLLLVGAGVISFGFSLLTFNGIAAFLVPILQVLYPGMIALTLLCIVTRKYKSVKIAVFYVICGLMLLKPWHYL